MDSVLKLQGHDIHYYYGPNPWSSKRVVTFSMKVDEQHSSALLQGALRLCDAYPDWIDKSALKLGDPVETISKIAALWALGALNEVRGYLNDAGAEAFADRCTVWVEFHEPRVTRLAIELALKAIILSANSDYFTSQLLQSELDQLWRHCARHHPDYQARILMSAARANGIPEDAFIDGTKYRVYGWGEKSKIFIETLSNSDGVLSKELSRTKMLSKSVIKSLGVPTPRHLLISQADELEKAVAHVGYPCVIKPYDLGGGKGVTAGITSLAGLHAAYRIACDATRASHVMLEQFVPGDDHRLMVVDGKCVAAIKRLPPSIIGDGRSTIRQLVDALNSGRSSNMVKSRYLRPIAFDDILINHLSQQGLSGASIPPEGVRIVLRSNANLSTGGVAIDLTSQVHPLIVAMSELMARSIGFGNAGFDYISTSISRSPWETGGAFIEMNNTPGYDLLVVAGWSPETAGALVMGGVGRIPADVFIVDDVNNNRHISKLASTDASLARVSGDQIWLGSNELRVSDSAPWGAVRGALKNKAVGSLQVYCTIDEIMKNGLPLDKIDTVFLCGVSVPDSWRRAIDAVAQSVRTLN